MSENNGQNKKKIDYESQVKSFYEKKSKTSLIYKKIKTMKRELEGDLPNGYREMTIEERQKTLEKSKKKIDRYESKINMKFDFDSEKLYITTKDGKVKSLRRVHKELYENIHDELNQRRMLITSELMKHKYDILFELLNEETYRNLIKRVEYLEKELEQTDDKIKSLLSEKQKVSHSVNKVTDDINLQMSQIVEQLKMETVLEERLKLFKEYHKYMTEKYNIFEKQQQTMEQLELVMDNYKLDKFEPISSQKYTNQLLHDEETKKEDDEHLQEVKQEEKESAQLEHAEESELVDVTQEI